MADLFPASAASAKDGSSGGDKPKRIRLMNQDTVAAKFLDPYAVSPLFDVDPATLWRLASNGDKWAAFWSELAATDEQGGDYRHGVFLSRFAEVCLNAGEELCSNEDFGKCIVPKILDKAKQEFERLKPHLERLNAGKGSQEKGEQKRETVGGLKRKQKGGDAAKAMPGIPEMEESAHAVYAWLEAGTNSNLRMLLNITSLGGVSYAFMAADKTTRAWVSAEKIQKEDFARKITARCTGASASAEPVKRQREAVTGTLFD